jgi:hypothetical protein
LIIDSGAALAQSESNKALEKFFITGIKKHAEINSQLTRAFSKLDL